MYIPEQKKFVCSLLKNFDIVHSTSAQKRTHGKTGKVDLTLGTHSYNAKTLWYFLKKKPRVRFGNAFTWSLVTR